MDRRTQKNLKQNKFNFTKHAFQLINTKLMNILKPFL